MSNEGPKLPVDTNVAQINILEEDTEVYSLVEKHASELNGLRMEIGRLFTIISNLKDRADTEERSLNTKKQELIGRYEIKNDGRWVIDFNKKAFVKLSDDAPNPV